MRIVKLSESLAIADGVRNLYKDSSGMPLSDAVHDLAEAMSSSGIPYALCGGLAVGVHARPRGTDDVDIILADESIIESFMASLYKNFRTTRAHAMVHKRTGVEVECITPQFVKIDPSIASKAIETAVVKNVGNISIPVVSREGLVAMKLCRGSDYDRGDIKAIIQTGGEVDLSSWSLPGKAKSLFEAIKLELSTKDVREELSHE